MAHTSGSTVAVRTRLLFAAVVLGSLYALCEACSLLAFRVLDGRAFSFARLHAEEDAQEQQHLLADLNTLGRIRRNDPAVEAPEVLHPYLGYVESFDPSTGTLVNRFGLPAPTIRFTGGTPRGSSWQSWAGRSRGHSHGRAGPCCARSWRSRPRSPVARSFS